MWSELFLTAIVIHLGCTKPGFGPTDQDWGHVAVRDNAHIFWWLHYTTAKVPKYTDKPLIIWLQGGPGASSTGYGNFAELGPLDLNLEPRNSTWVQWANILFVDNPAGCGFGYVDNNNGLVKNNTQIAQDFLVFLKQFYVLLPEFKQVPLYIFCESYGGKMTAEIALVIDQAIKDKQIESNFKGVGLGDSWISPVDSILGYAPYLLNLGQIDTAGYNNIIKIANKIKLALDTNDLETASSLWDTVTLEVMEETLGGVDFYNILTKIEADVDKRKLGPIRKYKEDDDEKLDRIMNDQVRVALNISQIWKNQNDEVYSALLLDFMNPVTKIVEKLLNETDLTVAVYNGQLDLIVDTIGTLNWVENLNFKNKSLWEKSPRNAIINDGYIEGFFKKYDKFIFYWVDRAGHMVPLDNPSAMYYILKDVTNDFKV